MKVKIWYTLYEGGQWMGAELDMSIYNGGCISFTPAVCLDEFEFRKQFPSLEIKTGRAIERFFISCLDFPIFAFTLTDPASKEYSKHVYDAHLVIRALQIAQHNMTWLMKNHTPTTEKTDEKKKPEDSN